MVLRYLLLLVVVLALLSGVYSQNYKDRKDHAGLNRKKDRKGRTRGRKNKKFNGKKLDFDPVSYHQDKVDMHCLEGTSNTDHYWKFGAGTVLTKDFVRLTPQQTGRHGWLWNEYAIESKNWEIEFELEIKGLQKFGGDGLGFWVISPETNPVYSDITGSLMGMTKNFIGLGVVVDTYDNDNNRKNPGVFTLFNPPGTKDRYFNADNDYNDQRHMEAPFNGPNNNQKARKDCVMDIRNHHKPVKFMVKFLHNVLHVYADLNDGGGYGSCLAVQVDQDLTGYHMAFTAQTGGASDLVEIKEISARYLDEADADEDDLSTTIEDYNSSKSGVDASMSGFFVFLLQLALIGLPIYKAQLISKSRLDEILLSKQLNGLGLAHLVVHGVSTLTLLLCGYLFIFFLALLQTVWFVLLVVKQKWKFTPPLRNTYAAGMSPLQRTYVTAGLQSIQFLMMLLSLLFF